MKKSSITHLSTTISNLTNQNQFSDKTTVDIALIGAGIMSATLGTYLRILEPNWTINMYERLDKTAQESSNSWNNAGTGHAAFCEFNYTPINKTGIIDITKAITVSESFEISRQFWAYLVQQKILTHPQKFITNTPHISLVWGLNNINYLRQRFNKMQNNTLFYGMEYSEDPQKIREWAPLVIEGRDSLQKVAATCMKIGTDINFGEITQQLVLSLQQHPQFNLYLQHDVTDIKRNSDKTWNIYVSYGKNSTIMVRARYVFIGSGGASLRLLQKSGIPEAKKYAGFPVGGQFLMTTNSTTVNSHNVKVYGKTFMGAPPISMPHIDMRIIDGKKILLFGPFASLSTKLLKYGSRMDFFCSLTRQNILPILQVGFNNLTLIKYLISQQIMSNKKRFNALCEYYPQAAIADWSLIQAGQRVQIIKKDIKKGGILQFGTEVVSSADGSLSVLLGASPGASSSAQIMLQILTQMFKKHIMTNIWQEKLKEIIPSYNQTINNNITLTNNIRHYTSEILGLHYIQVKS